LERVGLQGPRPALSLASCPAASSSGSPSPAPSPAIPTCCSPTNRPAIWTRKTGHRIVELLFALNREQGATLVLVTHDPELAAYCDRILELDDGRLRGENRALNAAPGGA
jgi:hypothetical protein